MLREEGADGGKDKKHFRIVAVLLLVFTLVMITGIALDIVFGIKLSDKQQEQQDAQKELDQLNEEEERIKVDRTLDLSNTNLLDFSLELNEPIAL